MRNVPFRQTFRDFLTTLRLRRISVEETVKVIEKIEIGKSSAVDRLSARLLKDALSVLPIHLAFLFNLSLDTGIFPSSWKRANVILIPKEGESSDPSNYRPISLLPLPGKLLEKLIHDRLMDYLMTGQILTRKQGGFRPGHSITLMAASFITDVLKSANFGQFTSAVFVDLRKAFDTIDHSILLRKLWSYGVRNKGQEWFKSYLTSRTQRTMVNGIYSDFLTITHGVPQGSVLGPVLFILYINDIINVISEPSIYLYADDTVIFTSGNDSTVVQSHLQNLVDKFTEWSIMNKLTLNIKKTKLLTFFAKRGNNLTSTHVQIMANGQPLDEVFSYKYLGYQLDNVLNYDILARQLIQKIIYKLYLLSKLRPMLSMKTALLVYKSKIMSYIDYNILFYPSFRKVYQKKLQILQNRAIRTILKLPKRTNVDNYHVTLRIWHIDTRFRFFLLKYMYTLAYGEVDLSIDRCPLSTRSHDTIAFRLPSRCSAKFMNSFIYIGRNLWNALGPDIKSIPTLNGFSMSVRSMLTLEERALHSP